MNDDDYAERPDYGEDIDPNTFEQIIEMDDGNGNRDFSKDVVLDFFAQAKSTFERMDEVLKRKDFRELSDLGNFLKTSAKTLGFIKVVDLSEKIEFAGRGLDETGLQTKYDNPDDPANVQYINNLLPGLKADCKTVERVLEYFYRDRKVDEQQTGNRIL